MPCSEPQQFEREVMPHLRLMMAMARRLTRNEAEAEDLVQDTLVKAFRSREQYRSGTNLKAWLLTILRNTFLNGYRRQKLHRRLIEGPDAANVSALSLGNASVSSMMDVESGVLQDSLQSALAQALRELPEEFSSVVILADVEELSYKEIAESMGCPVGTVMSRLHRGRRLLRTRLIRQATDLGLLPETKSNGNAQTAPGQTVALSDYRQKRAGN